MAKLDEYSLMMKTGICHVLLMLIPVLGYSQDWKKNAKLYIATWNTYIEDSFVEQERFFKIDIPGNFEVDTGYSFAFAKFGSFYSIRDHVILGWEGDDEKTYNNGIVDLVKFAKLIRKTDYAPADSSTVSGLIIPKQVEIINGFKTLRLTYAVTDIYMGKKSNNKCILYLVAVKPKGTQYDNTWDMVVGLWFEYWPGDDEQKVIALTKEVMNTIRD
jgi:hypothetical protein